MSKAYLSQLWKAMHFGKWKIWPNGKFGHMENIGKSRQMENQSKFGNIYNLNKWKIKAFGQFGQMEDLSKFV